MNFSLENYWYCKYLVDFMLMLSIIYFSFRVLKSPERAKNLTRLSELNDSLENLVKDANESSQLLSEHLLSRQNKLEKLLTELHAVETRILKINAQGEDIKSNIERSEKRVEQTLKILQDEVSRAKDIQLYNINDITNAKNNNQIQSKYTSPAVAPQEIEDRDIEVQPKFTGKSSILLDPQNTKPQVINSAEQKIKQNPLFHSEKIRKERATNSASLNNYNLSNKIEISNELQPKDEGNSNEILHIRQIYKEAENMIRAGNDVYAVSRRTRIPVNELAVLKEKLESRQNIITSSQNTNKPNELKYDFSSDFDSIQNNPVKRQTQTL